MTINTNIVGRNTNASSTLNKASSPTAITTATIITPTPTETTVPVTSSEDVVDVHVATSEEDVEIEDQPLSGSGTDNGGVTVVVMC